MLYPISGSGTSSGVPSRLPQEGLAKAVDKLSGLLNRLASLQQNPLLNDVVALGSDLSELLKSTTITSKSSLVSPILKANASLESLVSQFEQEEVGAETAPLTYYTSKLLDSSKSEMTNLIQHLQSL
jgi:hypothetical protein